MFEKTQYTGLRLLIPSQRHCAKLRWHNLRVVSLQHQWSLYPSHARCLQTDGAPSNEVPFRKQFKDEARRKRDLKHLHNAGGLHGASKNEEKEFEEDKWKLTVGLEIHAQLNTEQKLFSAARSSENDGPNSNIELFDLAFPGSQPGFQKATLVPALRAAVGLSCNIQRKSRFDRKHYYYQDQPAGYQITQYYEPFAKDGHVTLYDHDGIAPEDGESVSIEIKQIQMEQDTAKSTLQPPSMALLDFNRVGHPLVEIITQPQIHHPQTAAACVKKIQSVLQTVNAVTTGMELGGLRADVNVSVSSTGSGILGQRTEIKNLSSIKAVEEAIIAERNRQIAVLEAGGSIQGETRGWTLGSTETTRLRGKEGEVDYRYMPDPDIAPLIIEDDLTSHIRNSLPVMPDELVAGLLADGLTMKDAKTLISLDNGERLDYFNDVVVDWTSRQQASARSLQKSSQSIEKIVANWTLHELGGLLSTASIPFSPALVPAPKMADILVTLYGKRITGATAKRLLAKVFDGDGRSIQSIIDADGLGLQHLSQQDYVAMAQTLIEDNEDKVKQIQEKKQLGKVKWFVGQMVRQGEGKVEAQRAEAALKDLLGLV